VSAQPSPVASRLAPIDLLLLSRRVGIWAPPLAIGVAGFLNRWNSEDAFINFRVVDQVRAGNGPVFNAGERVEAATSTLWLAVLTIGSLLPGSLEWFAVLAGLAGTVAGTALAVAASARLARGTGSQLAAPSDDWWWLPFGSIVFVALPPVWHYATSGLETGLTFAWLGGSFWVLVRAVGATPPGRWLDVASAVLLGLGPLIRPDLALFSAGFLVAFLWVRRAHGRRRAAVTGATALALPLAYQVFRMGYYGSLVPNPALAKEASRSRFDQGVTYLGDLALPYLLWLPLTVVLLALGLALRRWGLRSDRAVVALAPVAAGLLHIAFVTRVGGDFMHGRLLLPGLFGLLAPLAVVPVRRGQAASVAPIAMAAMVATWGLIAALALRTDYHGTTIIPPENGGIADEHGFYVAASGVEHPVTVEDYRATPTSHAARAIEEHLEEGRSYVNLNIFAADRATDLPPRGDLEVPVVTTLAAIGIAGFRVGPDVWIVDPLGLADPFAARTELPGKRPGRIGHEKSLHPAWTLARFVEEPPMGDTEVAAAMRSLGCGDVELLQSAVRDPLTVGRFVDNLFLSPRLTALRLDALPTKVAEDHC
jgi:arabinofuranosyltransferase